MTVSLSILFSLYNEKYFNNTLPSLTLKYNPSITSAGKFISSYNLSTNIHEPIAILINPSLWGKDLQNALVHEMIHYYDCIYNKPSSDQWYRANLIFKTLGLPGWENVRDIFKENKTFYEGHNQFFVQFAHNLNSLYPELSIGTYLGEKL